MFPQPMKYLFYAVIIASNISFAALAFDVAGQSAEVQQVETLSGDFAQSETLSHG